MVSAESLKYYLHDDPRLPSAWAPWFSHEYITYFTVHALDRLMELPPVPVRPNPNLHVGLWPVGPRHIDLYKELFRDVQQLDQFTTFDYEQRNGEYSTEPPTHKASSHGRYWSSTAPNPTCIRTAILISINTRNSPAAHMAGDTCSFN